MATTALACGQPSPAKSGAAGSGGAPIFGNPATGGVDAQALSGSGGTSSVGGTECPAGAEQCDCYGNGTCNAGLVCASNLCVNLTGWVNGSAGGPSASSGGATTSGSTRATNPSGGAGSGGHASGGVSASGGGVATGGRLATGGVATGGAAATGGSSFWTTVVYSGTGAPTPADGHHNPGQNCMQCHVSGSSSGAPVWNFGGTIYQSDATTPAPNVQVGINDGTTLYTTYTASNGNFWLAGAGSINWAKAQVRIRDANGELAMAGATPASTCNLCHNSTTYPRITAP